MDEKIHPFTTWARSYLYNSGHTQSQLANQLNLSNARLSELINNTKNDLGSKNAREHILNMINVFNGWGVLKNLDEANTGLKYAGQPLLGFENSEQETGLLDLLQDETKLVEQHSLARSSTNYWIMAFFLTLVTASIAGFIFLQNNSSDENGVVFCQDDPNMIFIEAGSFQFGSTRQDIETFAALCPDDDSNCSEAYFTDELINQSDLLSEENETKQEVYLPNFCIDQFEVTVAEFEKFVSETNYETYAEENGSTLVWNHSARLFEESSEASWRNPDGQTSSLSSIGDHPVTHVNWYDANAFCDWRGMRLPTIFEWEKAARGTNGFNYPWGNDWDSSNSNHYILNRSAKETVGARPANISPYGVYDTVGNIMEWTATTYPPDATSPDSVERRGGSYLSEKVFHHVAWRNINSPLITNEALGFRCVVDQ